MDGEPRDPPETQDLAYWKARAERAEAELVLARIEIARRVKALRNHRCIREAP